MNGRKEKPKHNSQQILLEQVKFKQYSFTSCLKSHLCLTKDEASPRLSVSQGIQNLQCYSLPMAQLLRSAKGSGEHTNTVILIPNIAGCFAPAQVCFGMCIKAPKPEGNGTRGQIFVCTLQMPKQIGLGLSA